MGRLRIQTKIKILAVNQGLLVPKARAGEPHFRVEITPCMLQSVLSAMLTTTLPSEFFYLHLYSRKLNLKDTRWPA